MNRDDLVYCFQDTLILSESEKLRDSTLQAIESSKVYYESFAAINRKTNPEMGDIIIDENTSFAAAKKYSKFGKVCVLNFANPHNPGGGVENGAMAQEECLCRSSNLFLCLKAKNVFEEYYKYHREMENHFFSDRLIYTKNVTVFKDDSTVPCLMDEDEWFEVDVITCAAPYLGKRVYTNKKALKELFRGRVKNIFEAAIENGAEVIILGAFGCGAFKNPPEIVAEAFYEVIIENEYDRLFKKIVFAIKSTNDNNPFEPCPNIFAFENAFLWSCKDAERHNISVTTSEFGKLRWCDNYPIAQAVGSVELPSGKVLKGGQEFNPYYEWKNKNKYFGKQFSFLGDSISTLNGYNPRGYKVFYYGDNCKKADVEDFKDTWWGKVIDFFGAELLVNNSWSGSRVTKLPNQDALFPSGCSDERTSSLHINSVSPDVIIINLGTNDWAFGAKTGEETGILGEIEEERFENAYQTMLQKIKFNYPDAEIWCCTISETIISSKPEFSFPHKYAGIHIEVYNEIIRRIARNMNCSLIDLYNMKKPYDSIDGSHPNRSGMKTIAATVCYAMSDDRGKDFLALDKEEGSLLYDIYLSYGDFPVHTATISCGSKILYRNRIHGSRDGGLRYAEGFFDEKELHLDEIQRNRLADIVNNLQLEKVVEDNTIIYPGKPAKDSFKYYTHDTNWFDIRNPKALVDFCEEVCDFIPYETDGNMNRKRCVHNFVVEEEYTGGTKYICKKCGVIKHESFLDVWEKSRHMIENNESDEEYVYVDPNITTILYDGTIRLTDMVTGKEIIIKEETFDFGKNVDCTFKLDEPTISRKHATFIYERNNWFLRDNNSTNGTRINGVRIIAGKKYQLLADDVIEFANGYKYVFYKSKLNTENNLNMKEQVEKHKDEDLIGRVIGGKYLIKEIIGKGGLTNVYRAKDLSERDVAVKSILKESIKYKTVLDALLGEVVLLQKLNHPFIRKVVEQIEDETYIFIILEYVDGVNLEKLASNSGGILSVEQVVHYAMKVAEALQYAHSMNPAIINRDIKPRNIMVDENDNVKLVDFDIAMEFDPRLDDICVLGTKGYAPPEQYMGKTVPQSDIFALGMVMHQLLTGVNPVEPPYETRPIRQYNQNYSKGLERIIEKCTRPNPDERYSSCAELMRVLEREMYKSNKRNILEILGLKK